MLSHFRSSGRIRTTHISAARGRAAGCGSACCRAVAATAGRRPDPRIHCARACGGGDARGAGVLPRHRSRRARRRALQLVLEPSGRRRAVSQLRHAARPVPRRHGADLDRQGADCRLACRLQGKAERRPREHDRAEPRTGGVTGAAGHRRGLHQLSRAGRQGPAGRRRQVRDAARRGGDRGQGQLELLAVAAVRPRHPVLPLGCSRDLRAQRQDLVHGHARQRLEQCPREQRREDVRRAGDREADRGAVARAELHGGTGAARQHRRLAAACPTPR